MIGGNKLYINSYKLQTDDFNGYWTFSALLDHSSYKIATLSCSEPDTLNASIKYVTQFMESVRFELNKWWVVHEGIYQIYNSADDKYLKKESWNGWDEKKYKSFLDGWWPGNIINCMIIHDCKQE